MSAATDHPLIEVADKATDREWWELSNGHCGACGFAECHQGPCQDVCTLCPERYRARRKEPRP